MHIYKLLIKLTDWLVRSTAPFQKLLFYIQQFEIALVYSFCHSQICVYKKYEQPQPKKKGNLKFKPLSHVHFLIAQCWFLSLCLYALRLCVSVSVFVLDAKHFHFIITNVKHFIFRWSWMRSFLQSLQEVKHVFFFKPIRFYRKQRGCNVSKLLCLPVKSVGGEILHKLPNLFSPLPSIFIVF